ncbi:MAG: EAL domain-containing protein [Burkholderiales bacterium]|nr:EAL domain-containing protein [Burkholderiales bacterium]
MLSQALVPDPVSLGAHGAQPGGAAAASSAAGSDLAAAGDALASLRNARILMVDDDPVLIEVIQATLEEHGYANVVATTQPDESIELIGRHRPDVLLLDMVMPGIDGLTLLADLRSQALSQQMPVIVLTASSDPAIKLRALELGAADFLAKPVDPSELVLRLRNTLAAKAYRDRLAYYDPITGLPNRTMFMDRLDWACKQAARYALRGVLLHVDLDRFTQVNEALGPSAGDALLKQVGERLAQSIRASDAVARIGPTPWIPSLSRLGGDEFTILFPQVELADDAAVVAHRVLDALQGAPFATGEREVYVTASIGAAIFPDDGADADTTLKNAAAALREAKAEGQSLCKFYSKEFNARSLRRLTIETDLRRALERGELWLAYQPKVRAADAQVCGAEALLRWQHPEHGFVAPNEFIPLAEASGLIVPIGEWLVREACRQINAWREAGLTPVPVAINVSALQFRDAEFVPRLGAELARSGVPAHMLCVELTETVILDQSARTTEVLAQLRALGLKLSIDDFGAGYTSLSYLKNLPFCELKIDKSFIDDIETDGGSVAIVAALIALAQSLGLSVVAEGVEKQVQHALLRAKGCDQCQGYLFSKPLPAEEFTRYLLQSRVQAA